ncbi:MAG: hypothetical protein A3H49_11130 [Nitrospirae bacterium RIFCSPLOWO2_02_FULL_62_14]|nr:MAG: hypothetical protein A3H49_11130 [Nitrospirae bacterium RIFCSPLOWO2_02_FULL_62_14]OGW70575.1 MAG: hypothetical protein A3A88_02230 [Nitrospirae bacterium RIFCSPLOWO2_01_FULL_62_17]
MTFASQLIPQDYIPNLLHLVGFCFRPFGLQIDDLLKAIFGKKVMVATNTFLKSQVRQQSPQT